MKSRLDDQQGFTLVEIIVTIVILVVGLSALMGLFPVGLKASQRGTTLSTVATLAQMKMAEAAYLGYTNDPSAGDNLTLIEGMTAWNTGGTPYYCQSGAEKAFAGDQSDFSWHMRVNQVPDTDIKNLVQVTLQIYWNDEGRQRTERFITMIADYD